MSYPLITSVFLNVTDECNCRCEYCLPAGEKILMADGTAKNIEDIQIGDIVIGTQEQTDHLKRRRMIPTEVIETYQRETNQYLKITMKDGKTLRLTPNHPVLNGRGKWTEAKNLREQTDSIMSVNTNKNRLFYCNYIDKIELIQDKIIVYNFATTEHTYIANGLVVHNCFEQKHPHHMSLQTAKDTVDFLANNAQKQNDVPSINFFGGEPTLMWDSIIVPTVLYAKEKHQKFNFGITTNGILLTEDKLQFMKEHHFGLLLSIDGDKETQNINRPLKNGGHSFEILEPKLPMILQYYPNVMFRSTVTPDTCNDLFHNMMFAAESGFKNYFVIPNCFEEWSEECKLILANEMGKYTDYYIETMRNNKQPILFSQMEQNFPKIIQRNNCITNDTYRPNCQSCGKCGFGANKSAGISTDGSIYACQEFCTNGEYDSLFCIGSIYDGVDEEKILQLTSTFDNSVVVGDHCEDCILNRICDGFCIANNYFLYGQLNIVPDIYCEWHRILFNCAVKIMQTLGNDNNKLFKQRWDVMVNG